MNRWDCLAERNEMRRLLIVIFLLVMTGFAESKSVLFPWDSARMIEMPDWGVYFNQEGVNGTLVVFNQQKGKYLVYNKERFETPFLPASTFKIFNSLVALETGVVKNPKEKFKWDGLDRGNVNWNRSQDMKTAYTNSTVWVYQEIAKKIGFKRMQEWIDKCNYGNKDISGGIDLFWLNGKLRISAREQVEFLKRLQADLLPFKPEVVKMVKEIMIEEKTDQYILRSKTGWADACKPNIGWYVGYVERSKKEDKTEKEYYYFALNIDMTERNVAARKSIVRKVLSEMKVI